ncbi:hypothetical protein [Bartonella sp. B30(2025)]
MEILKHLFSTKRKQPIQKKFVATAIGHAPWGLGCAEYFYNLYEYEDGAREYEEFEGCKHYETLEGANFSTEAQVKAWFYGSALPKAVLNYEPLIDEINKDIKKLSETIKKLSKSAEK